VVQSVRILTVVFTVLVAVVLTRAIPVAENQSIGKLALSAQPNEKQAMALVAKSIELQVDMLVPWRLHTGFHMREGACLGR
jgi:hypothetical protein